MEAATELKVGLKKRMRKAIEAALITTSEVNNHREGFVRWAGTTAELAFGSFMMDSRENPGSRKDAPNKRIMPPN